MGTKRVKQGTKRVQDGYVRYREAGYNQGRQDRTGLEAAAGPVQANHVRHQSRQASIKSTFSFLEELVFDEQIPISSSFIYLHGNIWNGCFCLYSGCSSRMNFLKGLFF